MKYLEEQNPKDSNVYSKVGCIEHTTPTGSHPFRINRFSINMLSLRDKYNNNNNVINFATTRGEILQYLPNAEQLALIFNTDGK
jgi:hypothetical protein